MAKQIKKLQTPDLQQALTPELLGKIIKARRTQSELKLDEAAALCGLAKDTLMKIEHGNSSSRLQSVLQVCAGLGIKIFIKPWDDEAEDDWQ